MRGHLIASVALLMVVAPAQACSLVVVGGPLKLIDNNTALGSEGTIGATISVTTTLLDGPFTISITAPTWDLYPGTFPAGSAIIQHRTSTIGTLSMNFPYTSGPISKSFPLQVISQQVITLHQRITASKYPSGDYRTKSVVTCS